MFDEVLKKKWNIISYMEKLWIPREQIKDEQLLMLAFIHKSYAADFKNVITHNERLEFVGDGILGAIIDKLLFLNHPEMSESDMTLYKIALVREEILAEIARDIKLNEIVFISKGEEKMKGREKESILSDALEAVIGYIYLDLGHNIVERFIEKYIYSKLEHIEKKSVKSYKTMVQEIIQKEYKIVPEYKDIEANKDDKGNVTQYRSEIYVVGKKLSEWFGTNKKKAQEEAAKKYYESIHG